MEVVKDVATHRHFSHHHALVSTNSTPAAYTTCVGCNLNILSERHYYMCEICPFYLHQACYNMPRKVRHPGHPIHNLNLLVMPSSAKGCFKCKACGQRVTGFYYSCAECGICYHAFCLALPFSVAINSHSHTLKLEFSLPYDYECDLCQKPCFNGWLYSCRSCEFDTHLACAIDNHRAQSLQYPSIPHPDNIETSTKTDYGVELMQLVSQGIGRSDRKSARPETIRGAVVGWHENLRSPKQKHVMRNGMRIYSGGPLQSPGGNSQQSNLNSEDLFTLPSYQFSEQSCFSIDIAGSFSGFSVPNQEINETSRQDSKVVPVEDVKDVMNYSNGTITLTGDLEPAKEANKQDFINRLFMDPESRLNEAFLTTKGIGSQRESSQKNKSMVYGSRTSSEIKDQKLIPDQGRSEASCWSNFFNCRY